ncbi:MAG: right-handed parallel beta-helix repeat-containing protein [Alteromonadaceae bacterium]|nr:right-handed parallel beta-helix repeat-containing protein [Alteromonadaceae bacterium]
MTTKISVVKNTFKNITILLAVIFCKMSYSGESTISTNGGYSGEVLKVTNLKSSGPGSLKSALQYQKPRTIVFEVGGVIDLNGNSITIEHPFVSIEGQTAPYPGITIIKGSIIIQTNDVIVKHLSVRPGDRNLRAPSYWEPDGIAIIGGNASNVVIDHCSVSWAIDENISISGPRTKGSKATASNVLISNTIISEGLNNSLHTRGPHSKGILVHDFVKNVIITNNLFISNAKRNPYFKAQTTGIISNNIIYNPETAAIQLGYREKEFNNTKYIPREPIVSTTGNILIHGTDTLEKLPIISGKGLAYTFENQTIDEEGKKIKTLGPSITRLKSPPFINQDIVFVTNNELEKYIIKNVGSQPWNRNSIDLRIIDSFKNRNSSIINSQESVGGYPKYKSTYRGIKVPEEGLMTWLKSFERKDGVH